MQGYKYNLDFFFSFFILKLLYFLKKKNWIMNAI